MHHGHKIAAIIPALNEEKSISDVVNDLHNLGVIDEVIVCDNASTDSTAARAAAAGATVVSEKFRGYGAACLRAIAHLKPEHDIVLFIDADRSDCPEEAISLLDAIAAGADLAIGSRALGNAEPGSLTIQQRFGNWLSAFLIRLIWRHPITDLGPFRAIRRRALEELNMSDTTYGWTVEMQIKAIASGMKVVELPVSYRRRIGVSKISGTIRGTIGAGRKILGTIFLFALESWRPSGLSVATAAAILIILISGLWSRTPEATSAVPPTTPRPTGQARGMALAFHGIGEHYDYDKPIAEIAGLGADAVEFVIPWHQTDTRSADPGPRTGSSPTTAQLIRAIESAHSRKMKVYLLPIVLLEKPVGKDWRGVIAPRDEDAWWIRYSMELEKLARLAEEHHVHALSVGSEFVWSEKDEARWKAVIDRVRKVYSGKLLYSANWDSFDRVTFWRHLDAVGISSYFELTDDHDASEAELADAWRSEHGKILRELDGKPLIITEVGYPALDGGAVHPWDYTMKTRDDPDEQARALRAFFTVWHDEPALAAAFVYEWGLPDHVPSYSPRRRQAEKDVQAWMTP